jgi:glycosyltransferase involved in cell wall biosynthesis
MTIIQITPGAGAMFCGNCVRDNALVAELRRQGHDVTMLPLYLPLTLDEEDQSADKPIFFSGISVYLEQKSALFQRMPGFLHRLLATRKLLNWAAGRAARTRAADVGDIMLSMLRGEDGRQARELDELIAWLKQQPRPDVICLSNALLVGMARRLKAELRTSVVCTLQGEDAFLDALPETHRAVCWRTLAERTADVDLFIAPSRYFGDLMSKRLGLSSDRVRVVHNGINLAGFNRGPTPDPSQEGNSIRARAGSSPPLEGSGVGSVASDAVHATRNTQHAAPVLGFFARMCKEKGLDTLVDAYIVIKQRGNIPRLKLHIGGSCGPADELFVKELRKRLAEGGGIGETAFFPNVSHAEKLEFLGTLSVFSVPAIYGEAFGLYVIEAMAAGVPVVQPRAAAFTELVETTGGGVLCEPGNAKRLADAVEELLLNPARARGFGEAGRKAVFEKFSSEAMADGMMKAFTAVAALQK